MERLQHGCIDGGNAVDSAAQAAAERMLIAIEEREQVLGRDGRRIVLVLPYEGRNLGAADLDLRLGKRRMHHHVRDHTEHQVEILSKAGAHERQHVAADAEGERHALILEFVRDLGCGPAGGAPVQRS